MTKKKITKIKKEVIPVGEDGDYLIFGYETIEKAKKALKTYKRKEEGADDYDISDVDDNIELYEVMVSRSQDPNDSDGELFNWGTDTVCKECGQKIIRVSGFLTQWS